MLTGLVFDKSSTKKMRSFRKKGWDYSSRASYLVTLVTKDWYPFFGRIQNGKADLSEIGGIANECWRMIPDYYPFVELGEFIIMPEHIHGIIHFKSAQNGTKGNFGPQNRNLGAVIRGYKSAVTSKSLPVNSSFKWQKGYDDKILFHPRDIERASEYIQKNPARYTKQRDA
jgi:REP element-mobilizing transposase RayT